MSYLFNLCLSGTFPESNFLPILSWRNTENIALIPTGNAWSLCETVCIADWGVIEMDDTDFTCKTNHSYKVEHCNLHYCI